MATLTPLRAAGAIAKIRVSWSSSSQFLPPVAYHPDKHHRRSHRMKGYDYAAPGGYFITLCTHQRQCLFGAITEGQMQMNEIGMIIATEWQKSAQIRQEIELDAWVVMPNHFHGIVFITPTDPPPPVGANGVGANGVGANGVGANGVGANGVGANGRSPLRECVTSHPNSSNQRAIMPLMKPRSLSSLIAGFKVASTQHINQHRNTPQLPVWQRNYYDHIIRDSTALERIRQYIYSNPQQWQQDQLHPDNPSKW